jgi:hypothetical protein
MLRRCCVTCWSFCQSQHDVKARAERNRLCHLWLAAELKAPLAMFDEKLGRAAQIHLASLS